MEQEKEQKQGVENNPEIGIEEHDLDEAAHRQQEQEVKVPLAPTGSDDIFETEHDLDDEAHRQQEREG